MRCDIDPQAMLDSQHPVLDREHVVRVSTTPPPTAARESVPTETRTTRPPTAAREPVPTQTRTTRPPTAAREPVPTWALMTRPSTEPRWQTVDRALRSIASRRAALDAEEARWLREAEALQIWRPLGMVDAMDYLERVLGYAPRTAYERLRVARALGSLPLLDAALAAGTLSFSAVRELTRVVTPATEATWLARAAGKSLRQIEELVADHAPGDNPDDPPNPQARMHTVRFELAADTFALLRQARSVLDDEHGTNLSDDAFIAALCSAALDGASTIAPDGEPTFAPDGEPTFAPGAEPTGRARFQIALTLCRRCQQGWQEGAGAQIPVDQAAVDRALCDAQRIGSLDASTPERAYQDIPPSVERLVWRRDGGRCRVDGCRSARGLECHHIVHRADGGSHDASNIVLTCSACHTAHHRGILTISGTADRLVVRRPDTAPEATTPDFSASSATARTLAHSAAPSVHVGAPSHRSTAAVADPVPVADERLSTADPGDRSIEPHARSSRSVEPHARSPRSVQPREHGNANSKLTTAILCTQARAALTGLGWKPAIAQAAVTAAAAAAQGEDTTLERLIFESLRRCPVPRA